LIPAGEPMLRSGQYFKSTILILEGTIKLYLEGSDGEEFFLYFLEEGNACALSIMCSTSPGNEVIAKAVTSVKALMIPPEQMDQLIKKFPNWYYFLLETYNSRFQELLLIIDQIAFHSMEEKLAFYLRQHFAALKSNTISVTHQEIAADLNSSREVISRLLKKLEQDNRISISRNEISNIAL
jgi:CRP/FNR family transcriptional regulator, anaerobic regulatory protein